MACNNCYNGCSETTPDKCVKYTGVDIPELGIETGDSLAVVEQAIFTFLVPVLTGEGIRPVIDPGELCDLILSYLPSCTECTGFTLNELLTAIIQSVCDLQGQVDDNTDDIATINAPFTLGCLTGVGSSDGSHAILQAVITKLCSLNSAITAIVIDLAANYVKIVDINDYIQAYLDSLASSTLINAKMIPYCPMEYIGPLTNFDITGAGIGVWTKVYLMNGQNGTIDKRGRATVGATTMGSNPFPAATDPAIAGNPTYALGATSGANQVALNNANQLPPHIHGATSVVTDPGHKHNVPGRGSGSNFPTMNDGTGPGKDTSIDVTGITVATTIASTGAGLPHANIQPSVAVYYIIYIP